jgi:hypothetical protein
LPHLVVVQQIAALPFQGDLSVLEDIGMVAHLQGPLHLLGDAQDAEPWSPRVFKASKPLSVKIGE